MPIDYTKIYTQMLQDLKPNADDHSVKVRQNGTTRHFIERLLQFESKSVFPYACTISPKSSLILKNKSLKSQYEILVNYIRQTMPLYSNKYMFIFEIYDDNINMHTHGFVNFRTAMDIKKFRKDARQFFNIKLKEREQDRLTHVKLLGNDEIARQRWIGYCYTEMEWALKNNFIPIYRWDDEYIKPIQHAKPQRAHSQAFIDLEPTCYIMTKSTHKQYVETYRELESESDDESEQETSKEYLEYLRLKSKFDKKTSSNFIL